MTEENLSIAAMLFGLFMGYQWRRGRYDALKRRCNDAEKGRTRR